MKHNVPEYVYDLLNAFLNKEPLNFGKHDLPVEIQLILANAVKTGKLGTVKVNNE